MTAPPARCPDEATLRRAAAANIFLPGAGLFLLGHRRTGAALAGLFLVCFLAVMIVFLAGYVNYLKAALDPNVLQGDKLEQIGAGFHVPWVLGLAGFGALIYALAIVLFIRERARTGPRSSG